MRVLIHDTLATLLFAQAAGKGWLESEATFGLRSPMTASDIGADVAALVPAAEIARLAASHLVVPEIAIVLDGEGPIAMRVPVRPDEIEQTPVSLGQSSGLAEILARATLGPFYGIVATEFVAESADATVSVIEGIETLLPVEGGFQESLVRAWFILTGQPVVSHLLVAPKTWPAGQIAELITEMTRLRDLGHAHRSELRLAAATEAGIDRDLLVPVFAKIRYELTPADRRALLMLLQHGNKGSAYPYVWTIDYFEREPASE